MSENRWVEKQSTHFDSSGHVHMVDVSGKSSTVRRAVARCRVNLARSTAEVIQRGEASKGDVLAVARLAAIMATKQTAQLIPLCHPIPVEKVAVDFDWDLGPSGESENPDDRVVLNCQVEVSTSGKTGVEMEAMTAASVAGLTVYDMVKSVERGIALERVELTHKSGGKSGDFDRED